MNKKLEKLIIKQDKTARVIAADICDVIIEHFGTHNYKSFKDVVNEKLAEK